MLADWLQFRVRVLRGRVYARCRDGGGGQRIPLSSLHGSNGPRRFGSTQSVRRKRTEPHPRAMRITSRDLELLEAVGKLRFTTTSQLARLYFHSRSGANKRLRKLLDAGLVKVWVRQLTEEKVYSLTREGLETLDASGISVPRELDGNLGHLLMLNEVRIRFAFGLEAIGGSLAWWRSEWDLRAHGKERIIPDAFFAVSWEEAEQIFALEV